MVETKKQKVKSQKESVAKPIKEHKKIGTRGRTFEGTAIKVFPDRVTIEFERTVYIKKFERFSKKITRIKARLPDNIKVELGDLIRVQECRPLSKTIHCMVVKNLKHKPKEVKK